MNKSLQSKWVWEVSETKSETVVVIDVYAATTNINIILSKKPKNLIIVNESNYLLAKENYPDSFLVGESHQKVNFDIGNEPVDILNSDLNDKTVLYMSVNGTKALEKFAPKNNVISCSVNNLRSVASYLKGKTNIEILVIMSGSCGKKVEEDVICAEILDKIVSNEQFDWDKMKLEIKNQISDFPDYTKLKEESIDEIVEIDKYDLLPLFFKAREGWLETS